MIEPSHLAENEEFVVNLLHAGAEPSGRGLSAQGAGGLPLYRMMGMAPLVPPFRVSPVKRYTLDEFLRFDDQAFVAAAYVGLLGRYPDVEGGEHYLRRVREGASKIEVLGRLRYSTEGKRLGAEVPGLRRRYAFHLATRVPVLGRLTAVLFILARLPELLAMVRRVEGSAYRHAKTAVDRVAELDLHIARQAGTVPPDRQGG